MATTTPNTATIDCPACGGANAADAVFCADPKCRKALGEFDYVLEELRAEARWHEVVADTVTAFIGKPQFLGVHVLWFAAWILVNSGLAAVALRFDQFPFALLGIILTMESILITGFVLISQNRQNTHANKRAMLDYEVNVRTYRKIREIEAALAAVNARLDQLSPKE